MEISELLVKISGILNELNIPYTITGGVAVTIWGRPRYTADIDIVIDIAPQNLKEFIGKVGELSKGIYMDIDLETPISDIKKFGSFNLIHPESDIKVDFVIKKDDEFSQLELDRAIKKKIFDHEMNFISPEDLILIKLQWYKDSNSTRHLEDAESILKITEVDLKYIDSWAKKQGTFEIFEDLLEKHK